MVEPHHTAGCVAALCTRPLHAQRRYFHERSLRIALFTHLSVLCPREERARAMCQFLFDSSQCAYYARVTERMHTHTYHTRFVSSCYFSRYEWGWRRFDTFSQHFVLRVICCLVHPMFCMFSVMNVRRIFTNYIFQRYQEKMISRPTSCAQPVQKVRFSVCRILKE